MELTFLQSSILAAVQGFTEFLPISSSAHLILPAQLFGWPDQGLAFDVMVHLGSLLSVIAYFRADLQRLVSAWFSSLARALPIWKSPHSVQGLSAGATEARLAWCLLLATIPAGLSGLLLKDTISDVTRNTTMIALASIIFGLALLLADRSGTQHRNLSSMHWRAALAIGLAQCLALIPGTSRAGITMTAALLLGFSRKEAGRFSFLLAIPVIAASSLLMLPELFAAGGNSGQWLQLASAFLLSALVALSCIHLFLHLINRVGFLPFVLYRLFLGAVLLLLSLA